MVRAAKAEELAGPLLLLASRASSYMPGSVLRFDGGYAIKHLLAAASSYSIYLYIKKRKKII